MMAQAVLVLALFGAVGDAQLLCFGANWCRPCREMQPTLDRLANQGYPIYKIDVDQRSDLAQQFNVKAVPSFVLVDGHGRVLDRVDQATSEQNLRQMLGYYQVRPRSTTIRGQTPTVPAESGGAGPSLRTAPLSQVKSSSDDVQHAALTATVRLQVEDETGHSFGTGTVIDVHGQEALVLTCGHIFRDSQGKGKITVDRYDIPNAEPVTGTLVSYDLEQDLGLVSCQLTRPIVAARVASPQSTIQAQDAVFSIGCNHGQPPTIVEGKVNQVNRYLGPANITASGQPVDGRSGGGLFNRQGQLIGVCSAADPELNEGLYGALPRVVAELKRHGLAYIYEQGLGREPPITQVASTNRDAPTSTVTPISFTNSPAGHAPPIAGKVPGAANELICVIRGSAADEAKTFVIKNPSRTLLEYLNREHQRSTESAQR